MDKNLIQAINYTNQFQMFQTNLASNYSDQPWLFGDANIESYNIMSNGFMPNKQSTLNIPSQIMYYNNLGSQIPVIHSQTGFAHGIYLEQPSTNIRLPLSCNDANRRLSKKQNRINIPSVLLNFQKVKKSQSLNSDVPFLGKNKNQERFLNYNVNSQATNSTKSSIRARVKQINWPKRLKPAETHNNSIRT